MEFRSLGFSPLCNIQEHGSFQLLLHSFMFHAQPLSLRLMTGLDFAILCKRVFGFDSGDFVRLRHALPVTVNCSPFQTCIIQGLHQEKGPYLKIVLGVELGPQRLATIQWLFVWGKRPDLKKIFGEPIRYSIHCYCFLIHRGPGAPMMQEGFPIQFY